MLNDGGSAFPRPHSHDLFNEESCPAQRGMTLRDYFAGQALAGDLSAMGETFNWEPHVDAIADRCYKLADAMIQRRDRYSVASTAELFGALADLVDDYTERFDSNPSTASQGVTPAVRQAIEALGKALGKS